MTYLLRWRNFSISFQVPLKDCFNTNALLLPVCRNETLNFALQFTEQETRTTNICMYVGFTKVVLIWFTHNYREFSDLYLHLIYISIDECIWNLQSSILLWIHLVNVCALSTNITRYFFLQKGSFHYMLKVAKRT